nr:isochorismatase family protein [Dehalococcoidia bacterium]
MTQQTFVLDRDRAVVVIMDFQQGIVGTVARDPEGTVRRAASVLAAARAASVPVVHVVHRGGRFEAESPD